MATSTSPAAKIEANTRRVLEREIAGALRWERLALTSEQVRKHDLPIIIKHDHRYKTAALMKQSRPRRSANVCWSKSCALVSMRCCPNRSLAFASASGGNERP